MNKEKIISFDYIRAICSLMVVWWHMGGINTLIFDKQQKSYNCQLLDLVNFNLILLAVPCFIFLTCYLYARSQTDINTLSRRIFRMGILLVFWPSVLHLVLEPHDPVSFELSSFKSVASMFLYANGTIYYYFSSAILCLIVTHIISNLSNLILISGLALSSIIISIFPIITIVTGCKFISAYHSPLNFFPYSFIAVIIFRNIDIIKTNRTKLLWASALFSLIFCTAEYNFIANPVFFGSENMAYPSYTRASLIFSVIFIAIIATTCTFRKNPVIGYLSANSLALYCLHPFLIEFTSKATTYISPSLQINKFCLIFVVILLSYLTKPILLLFLRRELLE